MNLRNHPTQNLNPLPVPYRPSTPGTRSGRKPETHCNLIRLLLPACKMPPSVLPRCGTATGSPASNTLERFNLTDTVRANSSGWIMSNYLIGNISLLKAWSRSQLAVNYSGGGFFSTNSAVGNGAYQQLALVSNFSVESLGNANP